MDGFTIAQLLLVSVVLLMISGTVWHFVKPPKPHVNDRLQARGKAALHGTLPRRPHHR